MSNFQTNQGELRFFSLERTKSGSKTVLDIHAIAT